MARGDRGRGAGALQRDLRRVEQRQWPAVARVGEQHGALDGSTADDHDSACGGAEHTRPMLKQGNARPAMVRYTAASCWTSGTALNSAAQPVGHTSANSPIAPMMPATSAAAVHALRWARARRPARMLVATMASMPALKPKLSG